jgi:Ca2+-transporting ATPase
VWEALHDQTLIILMVAAAAEIGIGIYKSFFAAAKDQLALIDGAAILIASKKKIYLVLIVVGIGSISDYRKQAQFRALSEFGKSLNTLQVIRGGEDVEITSENLVVGDIVHIQTGVVVPADGVLISGFSIACDESSMTGEPHAIEKDKINDPFLLSGTNVVNGVGKMLVICTGTNSLNGRSLLALEIEQQETPLQQKLNVLADLIATFAFYLAISMIIILGATYFIVYEGALDSIKISSDLIGLLILAVTVVVVAVPEGLPLAVTLSLAHATLQMLKDNNLVRHLSACETMGNATTICSDKTGTLTLNKMTVVKSFMLDRQIERENVKNISFELTSENPALKHVIGLIAKSLNVNSTASESKDKEGNVALSGSKTEIAILEYWEKMGYSYKSDRSNVEVVSVIPFSSDRKRMTCVIKIPVDVDLSSALGLDSSDIMEREFICVKGASEIVLRSCTRFLNKDGKIVPLSAEGMSKYLNLISSYAEGALRTICCAIKPIPLGESGVESNGDIKDDENLVLVMIFGILDPLREEVPIAVKKCQSAGIVVRMVTGDSVPTARAIALGCGILSENGIVMEGPDFRKLSDSELDKILPNLRVLARSSPLDKQILVNSLKRLGETVAVTGGM